MKTDWHLQALAVFIIGGVLAGCAVPVPLSERMTYAAEDPTQGTQRRLGLGATYAPAGPLRRIVRRRVDPADTSEVRTLNAAALGLAFNLPVRRRARSEVNLSVGVPVLGLDGTKRLESGYALTAAVGWGRGQLIVQRALVDTPRRGVSLGAFGRVDRVRADTGPSSPIDFGRPEEATYVSSFGGRVMGRTRFAEDMLQGAVSISYMPPLNTPLLRISLALYGFK